MKTGMINYEKSGRINSNILATNFAELFKKAVEQREPIAGVEFAMRIKYKGNRKDSIMTQRLFKNGSIHITQKL